MFPRGEVTEWPKVPDSKSGVVQATAGSNPALSAKRKGAPHGAFSFCGESGKYLVRGADNGFDPEWTESSLALGTGSIVSQVL
jgi:hypothetical protein